MVSLQYLQETLRRLNQIFDLEAEAVSAFIDVLEREEKLLVAGDTDALAQLAAAKTEQGRRLQLIGDQRLIALTSLGIANNVEAIGDFLARDPKLLAKWDKLLQRADVARERNRVNGQLIAKRMQHNQQALTVLLNASNQPGLYGADGQHRAMGTGRSLGSA